MDVESYIRIIDTYEPAFKVRQIPDSSLAHFGIDCAILSAYDKELVQVRNLLQKWRHYRSDFFGPNRYLSCQFVYVGGIIALVGVTIANVFELAPKEFLDYFRQNALAGGILSAIGTIIYGELRNFADGFHREDSVKKILADSAKRTEIVARTCELERKTDEIISRVAPKLDSDLESNTKGFFAALRERKARNAFSRLERNRTTLNGLRHAFASVK
ncbi:MAG: hypothetical protein WCT31_02215 [Candidatus Micrarchaeia archaeon]|jgi:hypothetical protein